MSSTAADGQARRYPFTAVVGQDQLKLALILSAISPGIGGVLIRGEKGTAKSTIVRALGPFVGTGRVVDLPIGATEDRVVGSLDLTSVLREGRAEFTPGLLAQANEGVLYIDEVNLLADHLVDVLLDAAASGRVTVERDGVSHTSAADFVLVGTMNPEEGELRPQLLDRFGLAVDVTAPRDVTERVEIISRRMAFDADPEGFCAEFAHDQAVLAAAIERAHAAVATVDLPVAQLRRIAGICAHLHVDGLRGDIVVARAAKAHAALRGAASVSADDVRVAVELALPHRRRRDPFDDSGVTDSQMADALAAGDAAAGDDEPQPPSPGGGADAAERDSEGTDPAGADPAGADPAGADPAGAGHVTSASDTDAPASGAGDEGENRLPAPASGGVFNSPATGSAQRMRRLEVAGIGDGDPGRRSRARSRRGHDVAVTGFVPGAPVHLFGTVLAALDRELAGGAILAADRELRIAAADLRGAARVGTEGNLVVFMVDLSGSMTARKRLGAVAELCVEMLRDSYTRRDRVAVIVARGSRAEVVVPPTKSVDMALRGLSGVRTGGRTPLAEGLTAASDLITRAARTEPRRRPLLVVLTDGRATAGADAPGRARRAARALASDGVDSIVVDCEQGVVRLGLAADLARDLGARLLPMHQLSVAALTPSRHRAA